jgi:hypothetical protein
MGSETDCLHPNSTILATRSVCLSYHLVQCGTFLCSLFAFTSFVACATSPVFPLQLFILENLVENNNFLDAIRDTRKLSDDLAEEFSVLAFPFGFVYQYWSQYLDIGSLTLYIICIATASVVVTTLFVQFSPGWYFVLMNVVY